MGRPKNSKDTEKRKTRTKWTSLELTALIELYPTTKNEEIAVRLNKSKDSVKNRAKILGLKKQ